MDARRSLATCRLVLAVLLVLSACGSAKTSDPGALTGVQWKLVQSSDTSAGLGSAGITATFDGKQVGGFSGVNHYGGPYTAGTDGSFKVGPLSVTLIAGPEPLMKAEASYLKLLQACTSYRVDGGGLTLSTGAGKTLVYEQASAAQPSGSP